MSAILLLTGVALLALPGLVTSRAGRLRPEEWRRLNRTAIRLGFTMVAVGLVAAAAPLALDVAGVDVAAHVCHHLLGPAAAGSSLVGGVSLVMSVSLAAVACTARRRSRRVQRTARIENGVGEHRRLAGATLVVLPLEAVTAYATPGAPAQVVVSRGLLQALTADEVDAVVRHELAHLRNGHHRDLVLAGVVDATLGWLPGLRASTAALRLSLERSADEVAAGRPGARDSTRRALLKATGTMLGPVPAFTAALTLLARLHALETPSPDPALRQRFVAFAPLAALTLVAAAGLLACAMLTRHGVLHLLGDCPSDAHPLSL